MIKYPMFSGVGPPIRETAPAAPAEGGGGGYVASAVTLEPATSISRTGALTGVVDGPTGFASLWVHPDAESAGVDFCFLQGGNFELRIEGGGPMQPHPLQAYLYNEAAEELAEIFVDDVTVFTGWNHVLVAWDMGHASGDRLFTVYLNDALLGSTFDYEEGGAFDIDYTAASFTFVSKGTGNFATSDSFSDSGLWLNSTILEANGTISEVNRRKFIDALGKPVDPTNWPANPVVKFVGNAAAFATNQGTGGAFAITGALSNASTSPSD